MKDGTWTLTQTRRSHDLTSTLEHHLDTVIVFAPSLMSPPQADAQTGEPPAGTSIRRHRQRQQRQLQHLRAYRRPPCDKTQAKRTTTTDNTDKTTSPAHQFAQWSISPTSGKIYFLVCQCCSHSHLRIYFIQCFAFS